MIVILRMFADSAARLSAKEIGMSVFANKPTRPMLRSWLSQELDRLEAPDRTFIGHRDIVTRSMARYRFVAPHLHGVTLDVGCGRGYGFDMILGYSSAQIGVDISADFLRVAQSREPQRMLAQSTGERLPFLDGSFDSIISFEVIEHIEDDVAFLRELRRIARPNAFIAISTPNRQVVSGNVTKPLNPFHVREYLADEFIQLLHQEFERVTVFGQHDGEIAQGQVASLVDCVPMRWKYIIPSHIQGILSILVRPPLRLEDCRFESHNLERAHTFLALCYL